MGHDNFLKPTVILVVRINVGHINIEPTLNLVEISMANINFLFSRNQRGYLFYFVILWSYN